jgi:1-acyl-sn-glycerol-3-phosphate acyltransferase
MEGKGFQVVMAYKRGEKISTYSSSFIPSTVTFHFILLLVVLFNRLIFRLRIEGRERLHGVASAMLVSNHTLVLDPGIIAHALRPHRSYFTMLEDTACIPLLGTFVRLLGAIPIPTRLAGMKSLERTIRRNLQDLHFVHVFPEGECYLWNQEIKDFQLGAFYLACRLGLPIVPITTVLHERRWLGRTTFHVAGRTLRVPPKVTAVLGEAMYPKATLGGAFKLDAVEMSRKTHAIMQRTIDQLGGSKSLSKGKMPRLALQQM